MKANQELIGKTITGAVAVSHPGEDIREIWMLQFSDGSHVEFVSPSARRRLIKATGGHKRAIKASAEPAQMRMNVA